MTPAEALRFFRSVEEREQSAEALATVAGLLLEHLAREAPPAPAGLAKLVPMNAFGIQPVGGYRKTARKPKPSAYVAKPKHHRWLTAGERELIRLRHAKGETLAVLAKAYGVSTSTAHRAAKRGGK
jgi:hypothetical protein